MISVLKRNIRSTDWAEWQARLSELLKSCNVCPRCCGANRLHEERGFCGVGNTVRVSKTFIHYGEEELLNPAHTIYFTGCNMRCAFCSNQRFILNPSEGGIFSADVIAEAVDRAFRGGQTRCVELLGGEPFCQLSALPGLLSLLKEPVPVVWNSNMYATPAAFELVREVVDFWVADLKFGNDPCAAAVAATPDYFETVTANLRRIPPEQLIIRHLPLHGHLDCCMRPALEWIAEHHPDTPVSIAAMLPDSKGCCNPLDAVENSALDKLAVQLQINRIQPVLHELLPDICAAGSTLETELLIRPDGSIVLEDISGKLLHLLEPFVRNRN